jgi:hypothetical protein
VSVGTVKKSTGRFEVILEEGAPALCGWCAPPRHQPRNGPLRDLESQLQQLPMDPRRAPMGIRDGHLPNHASDVSANLRAAAARTRLAGPVPREGAAMPCEHRGGRTTTKADFQSGHARPRRQAATSFGKPQGCVRGDPEPTGTLSV